MAQMTNEEHKKWQDIDQATVYGELYNEGRRFRDYQLEFAKWSISIMLAFAGGYLALTTHGYLPGICSRVLFGIAIVLLGAGTVKVILHADFRYNEIKDYTTSIQPGFMRFDTETKRIKPHHVMIFLVALFTLIVCVLISVYPPRKVLASQDVPPKESSQSSVNAAGATHVVIDSLPHEDKSGYVSIGITFALAVIGAITFIEVRRQAIETAKAAKAAAASASAMREELILTQRPRIIVRNFYLTTGNATHPVAEGITTGEIPSGQFYAVNVGGTDATIVEWHCQALIGSILPMKRPYEGQIGIQENRKMPPGSPHTFQFQRHGEPIDQKEFDFVMAGTKVLYVIGWIGYQDELRIYRRTAFCRRYDLGLRRFIAVDNPDYEHAE